MLKDYTLVSHQSISEIPKPDWQCIEDLNSPFSDWDFLYCLEVSQCVGHESGWIPCYLTVWDKNVLVAATFFYEKYNSYGEYIFDWSWAEAARQAGIQYYPKLVSAIPFTPASCHKILIDPKYRSKERESELRIILFEETEAFARKKNLTSSHFLFTSSLENEFLLSRGYLLRHSFQYHWENKGFKDFAGFLTTFKSRKSKQIRKEREKIKSLHITTHSGDALTYKDGEDFFSFYRNTIEDKNAIPYLNKNFFSSVFQKMKENIFLVKASEEGECIAQALYFYKGEKLFGRYWGSKRNIEFLHFELCYYQGIDFSIAKGIKVFEAGAQGEHKIARGFVPTITFSAHDFDHQGLKDAVENFLQHEKQSIKKTFEHLEAFSPYKEEIKDFT